MSTVKGGSILDSAITTGVTIITTRNKQQPGGMTAAWVTQVSLNPVLLAVSIAPQRNTHHLIKSSGYFCVNVLAEGQEDLGRRFGLQSGRNTDKFKDVTFKTGAKDIPVLEGVKATIMCELVSTHTAGDHDLFIGKAVSIEEDPAKKALVFRTKDYF